MTLGSWLVILLLILINTFYVAAEFAAVSVRSLRIRQLAEDGSRTAQKLLPVLEDAGQLDRYIAACQIGITLSSLILGAYSQATVALDIGRLLVERAGMTPVVAHSASATGVLIGLTALQVVVGELIPKSLALQFPTEVALATLYPMQWSLWLYRYTGFMSILNGSGLAVLRLFGMQNAGHRHIHRPEEIELLIAESRDGGLLEPDEQLRLHRTLRLGVMPVRKLMVPRVHLQALDANTTEAQLREQLLASSYSRLPVYEHSVDNIIGVIHLKDVVSAYVKTGRMPGVRDIMRPAVTVPETMMADELLRVFHESHTQQAIVSDEFGGVAGLVTLGDVLEEVLGDVSDDPNGNGQREPEWLPDGRVRLPGLWLLDDVEPWIGVRWTSEANTVAGHVMHRLGRLPGVGEVEEIDGVQVEIEDIAFSTIASVLVTPAPTAGGDADG